jgi:hypothetical protein
MANRFQKRSAITSLFIASFIAFPACAQTAEKTMAAGGTLNLGHFGTVNPDCTRQARRPSGSRLSLPTAPFDSSMTWLFGYFWKPHVCSNRRVYGVTVEYRPERGFVGIDRVGLDIIYSTGDERMWTVNITVK